MVYCAWIVHLNVAAVSVVYAANLSINSTICASPVIIGVVHFGYKCHCTHLQSDSDYKFSLIKTMIFNPVPYSEQFWWDNTLANLSFQSFGKEN